MTVKLSAAWKHATQWQITFGSVISATLVASQVLDNDLLITANGIVMLIAFSWLVSWSAIWCVLGDGTMWRKVLSFVAVHHVSILLAFFCPFVLSKMGVIGSNRLDLAELVMMFTAMAYVSTAELFVMMGIIAVLRRKSIRLRLRASNPTRPSQQADCKEPAIAVPVQPLSLADLLALTALIAVHLAAWRPVVVDAMGKDNGLFGASFAFYIVSFWLAINAVIALFLVLPPMLILMASCWTVRSKRARFLFVNCFAGLILVGVAAHFGDDAILIPATIGIVLSETMMFTLIGRNNNWFRFELFRD